METITEVRRTIGRCVREERKKQGLTQAALGRRAKMSRQYVSTIERGSGDLPICTMVRIANALGVGMLDLLR